MTTEDLRFRYEKDVPRKVAYVTFSCPEKLNAMREVEVLALTRLIHEVNEDEDVKVLVFRGEGRAFGSGHDVAELGVVHDNVPGQRRPPQRKRLAVDRKNGWGRPGLFHTLCYCQKATVAEVQGLCYGGHMELVNCCDIAVASEDAMFTHPGFRYIGPLGGIGLFIETMGLKKVKEMMLTGIPVTAQQAVACGLVNKVVPLERLHDEAERMVEAIVRLPFDGICMGKAAFEAALDALGVGSSWNMAYIIHAMQTDIRYEPEEFNLFKARRDQGVKGAIVARETHYGEELPARG